MLSWSLGSNFYAIILALAVTAGLIIQFQQSSLEFFTPIDYQKYIGDEANPDPIVLFLQGHRCGWCSILKKDYEKVANSRFEYFPDVRFAIMDVSYDMDATNIFSAYSDSSLGYPKIIAIRGDETFIFPNPRSLSVRKLTRWVSSVFNERLAEDDFEDDTIGAPKYSIENFNADVASKFTLPVLHSPADLLNLYRNGDSETCLILVCTAWSSDCAKFAEDYNQLGQKHGRHRIAVLLLEHRELTLGLLEATNLISAMPYLVAARDGEFQLQYDKLGDMEFSENLLNSGLLKTRKSFPYPSLLLILEKLSYRLFNSIEVVLQQITPWWHVPLLFVSIGLLWGWAVVSFSRAFLRLLE
eukprot:TRINITY_DN4458_c0_g1_i2.p1 TRINITY_DN4458_c0_g1~~TRINITY_DN4458_c0_g1_i2.p1  ORF type:complete len:356 (+),score=64.27 TRINITY_DN4458_c0_g1_i2:48-1115(+)